MERSDFFERYASVVVGVGLNLQPGQEFYVRAPIEAAELVHHIVRAAYRHEAKYVHVEFNDQRCLRARIETAPAESLGYVPPGLIGERLRIAKEGGASLRILGEDPMGLAGVDPERRGTVTRGLVDATIELASLGMKDAYNWCVISMPNPVWAARVYPDLPEAEALEKLTNTVAHACRLDTDDPVQAWRIHSVRLMKLVTWLNREQFDRLDYFAPGTNFTIGLPGNHVWIGAESTTPAGYEFIPNLPTDEIFTAPDSGRANGTITTTRPMILGGTNVGIARFTVSDGRITGATCEGDQVILDQELDIDETARRFGEVALVTEDSPVAETRTTFYDGLYDENAGCHFAFGNAYSACVAGGKDLDSDGLRAAGLNVSKQHVDFTVGSGELDIIAVRADGSEFPLMAGGLWTDRVREAAGID